MSYYEELTIYQLSLYQQMARESVEFYWKQTYKLINDLHINRTSGSMQAISEALHIHESLNHLMNAQLNI